VKDVDYHKVEDSLKGWHARSSGPAEGGGVDLKDATSKGSLNQKNEETPSGMARGTSDSPEPLKKGRPRFTYFLLRTKASESHGVKVRTTGGGTEMGLQRP